jgi:hypothetical protein
MNGRLYDPIVGRMLSPDNFIQNSGYTQNYNRYSYVYNNPLKYNDPDGQCVATALSVLGSMYISGSKANGWQLNPAKWNWSRSWNSANTYGALWSGAQFGWSLGKSLEGGSGGAPDNMPEIDPAGMGEMQRLEYLCSGYGGMSDKMTYAEYYESNITGNFYRMPKHTEMPNSTYLGGGIGRDLWVTNTPSGGGGIGTANTINDVIGVAGDGVSLSKGTFRLTKSGLFSPGYYSSGWRTGNQYVKNLYSVSKVGRGVGNGADLLGTGIAYYQIANGTQQPITYVDAGVGTAGIIASGASYFYGVQIPVVGEFVAVYGAARLTWDVFYNLGANYGPTNWYGTNNDKYFK